MNDKNADFVEEEHGPVLSGSKKSCRAVAADVSGDGWDDLYVVNSPAGQPNQLFISQGTKGGFVEVTSGPAVSGSKASGGAVILDANGDGWNDLYVVNTGEPNQLFHNDKNGGFAEQKSGPAVTGSKASGGAVVADVNGDGAPDLYVVNVGQPNQLFVNDPCPDGFATSPVESGTTCYACPGYATDSASWVSRCRLCPGGTVGPAGLRGIGHAQRYLCLQCVAGTYRAERVLVDSCANCKPGYSSYSGAAACVACEAGRFADKNATAGSCPKCPGGSFSKAGARQCTACGAGTFADAGATVCAECRKGSASSATKAKQCEKCKAGQYSAAKSTFCTDCKAGFYDGDADASTNCQACAQGTVSKAKAKACTPCTAGLADEDKDASTACSPCGAGKFSKAGTTNCTACAAGKRPNEARSGCAACQYPTYFNVSQGACIKCDAGRQRNVSSATTPCETCAPGKAGVGGQCTSCSSGQKPNTANTSYAPFPTIMLSVLARQIVHRTPHS